MNAPSSKTSVVLLANGFPYGDAEPQLASEVEKIAKDVDLTIVALSVPLTQRMHRRSIPEGVRVEPVGKMPSIFYVLLGASAVLSPEFRREVQIARDTGRDFIPAIFNTVRTWGRAHWEAWQVSTFLRMNKIDRDPNLVLYASRMGYTEYLTALLKAKFPHAKIILKGHGSDLHPSADASERVPFRDLAMAEADHVVVTSQYGRRYLLQQFPHFADKVSVTGVGTPDHGRALWRSRKNEIRLVSASHMDSAKRVPMIAEGLRRLNQRRPDLAVSWTHYGTGEDMNDVRSKLRSLPRNVSVTLKGSVSHRDFLNILRTKHYDLFVSASANEGISTKMLESLSFGIPVIGADAGGIPEIIEPGINGWLIDNARLPQSLADQIESYLDLSADEKARVRVNARQTWEKNFQETPDDRAMSTIIRNLVDNSR